MLATNDEDSRRLYSFSGMKQEPEKEPEKVLVSISSKP
jgi:hypothetical protein